MSAYLMSDDVPYILEFTELTVSEVSEQVQEWMEGSKVLTLTAESAEPIDIGHTLVNWGAVRMALVRDEITDTEKPIVTV